MFEEIENLNEDDIYNLYDSIIENVQYLSVWTSSVWYVECDNGRNGDWTGYVNCYYNRGANATCNLEGDEKWIIRRYEEHTDAFDPICGYGNGGKSCLKSISYYCPR